MTLRDRVDPGTLALQIGCPKISRSGFNGRCQKTGMKLRWKRRCFREAGSASSRKKLAHAHHRTSPRSTSSSRDRSANGGEFQMRSVRSSVRVARYSYKARVRKRRHSVRFSEAGESRPSPVALARLYRVIDLEPHRDESFCTAARPSLVSHLPRREFVGIISGLAATGAPRSLPT